MADKIAELHRINDPRVEKIVKMLDVIAKSGKSLRVHELDMVKLLAPVTQKLGEVLDRDAVAFANTGELAPEPVDVPATPPVAREVEDLQHLTTQQLVDRMIACGAVLAARRK